MGSNPISHPTFSAPHSSNRPSLPSIQALRGIAALMVVLWHGSRFVSPYCSGAGTRAFGAGNYMGVDLFFVVSGFIMVYTTHTSDGSAAYAWNFMKRRLLRIWPAYVALTVLYVATSGAPVTYFLGDRALQRIFLTAAFFPTAVAPPPPMLELPMLAVGWSLNYEMYFYGVLALSMLLGRMRWVAFFGWIAFTLVVLRLARDASIVDPQVSSQFPVAYANLATDPIVWLFAAGVVIGLLYEAGLRIRRRGAARAALAIACMAALAQYASQWQLAPVGANCAAGHGIIRAGLTAIPLVLVAVIAWQAAALRIPRAVVYLGDISFSLYLVHPMVQEWWGDHLVACCAMPRLKGFDVVFLVTAACIAAAAISHRLFEQGVSEWLRSRLLAPRVVPNPAGKSAIAPLR